MNKVLIIGKTWPESNSTGAGVRMMQLIHLLSNHNFSLTFCSSAKKSELSDDLPFVQTHSIRINDDSFNDLLIEIDPAVVIFDRFNMEEQYGWRVRETLPKALTILDTEDLHSLRKTRQHLLKEKGFPFTKEQEMEEFLNQETTLKELASIYRCDLNLIISEYEHSILVDLGIPSRQLFNLPMFVNSNHENKVLPSFEERKDVVFIGNFNHEPNIDCLKQIHAIFPEIKKIVPDAEAHIYGSYLKDENLKKNKNGVLYHGWTHDISQVLSQSRLLFAPIRFGAGVKSKILEAISQQTPISSTPIGFEGLCNENNCPGITGILDHNWINQTIQLYNSKEKWTEASLKAKALKNELYKDYLSANLNFIESLSNLLKNLHSHRSANLIGNMLHLEQNRSYKFMSKYIIEKNKRRPNS